MPLTLKNFYKQWWQPWANTIAYYKINDNDTTSTIYDLSGNNHHLTWYGNGAYTTDANYGRVMNLTWSNYATLNGYVDPNSNNWTLICLVKYTVAWFFVWQWSSWSALPSWSLWPDTFCFCQQASTNSFLRPNPTLSSGTWHLMIWVVDWNTKSIYVDGQLNTSATRNTTNSWNSGAYFSVWYNRSDSPETLTWEIKTIIFENKAWTQAEVEALAQEYWFTV